MTTSASSMTGDSSEVFSKHTPAQKKILLIDDQRDTSLCVGLQQEGYEVIAVKSPQKAWGVVWTLRPHFIIIHLTNLRRKDISTLQGCGVLAGGVPIIIAAPVSGSGSLIKALEKVAAVFFSFPMGPSGIGEILHDLEMSDRGMDSRVFPVARAFTW
jgi:DNA-binding NtrC family response regulator